VPITDHFTTYGETGIEAIGLDAREADRVFLLTGTTTSFGGFGHLLRSTNRGTTWDTIELPFKCGGNDVGRQAGDRLAVDPCLGTVLFAGTRQQGLYVSRNRGDSWSQVTTFPLTDSTGGTWPNMGVTCVVIDGRTGTVGSTACSTIYAGAATTGTNFYRSTDGGTTWTALPNQPTMTTPRSGGSASAMFPFHAVMANNGALYVTYGNSMDLSGMSDGEVYRFNTADDTWTRITPDKAGQGGFSGVATLPGNGAVVMVTTYDRWWPNDEVYRSTDSGTTWRAVKGSAQFDASYSPFLRNEDGTVRTGHWVSDIAIDPVHPDRVMYTSGDTVWGCDDVSNLDSSGTTHWQPRTQGLEEIALYDLVCPPAGALLFSGVGDQGGFLHTDLTVSPNSLVPRFNAMTGVAVAWLAPAIMARVGFGPASGTTGCWSNNSGATWTSFPTVPVSGAQGGTVAITADGSAIIWAPKDTQPYRSTDHGATWTACSGVSSYITPAADPADATKVYAIASNGTLYRSTDGGASFTAGATVPNITEGRVQAMPGRSGDLWITSWNGLFRSTDGGVTVNKVGTDVTTAKCVGFGQAALGKTAPAIFLGGTIGGNERLYRSDDLGANWKQITDANHHWGDFIHLTGDMRVYGRCFLSTNGRGIIVGTAAAIGSLALRSTAATVSETAGTVSISVSRTGGGDGAVAASWQTVAGTAAAGVRYTAASGTLTWADGDTADKTISVPLINDAIAGQGDQTFTITLSKAQGGATLGAVTSAVITVTDDDVVPTHPGSLTLRATAVTASESAGMVSVAVGRTDGSDGGVSVSWQTVAGSAAAGVRYTAASGTLTWADGDVADKTISVPLINDTMYTGDQTFTVVLSTPQGGATLGAATSAVVTVTDDETVPVHPGSLALRTTAVSAVESAGTVSVSVGRTDGSDGGVSVSWQTVAGSAAAGVRYTAASGTLTWAAGDTADKTIAVSLIDDAVGDQGDQSFTIVLSTPQGGVTLGTATSAVITVTDDDSQAIDLTGAVIHGAVTGTDVQVTATGATVTTHSDGTFDATLTVTSNAAATATVTATDGAGGTATAPIRVDPGALAPAGSN
jgi:hypothetical protein